MATIIRPTSSVAGTDVNWLFNTADYFVDVADESDSTYVNPDSGITDEIKFVLASATPGPSTNVLSIRCADFNDTEPDGALTVKLYQGVTLKQTFTIGPDLGGTPTTRDLSVTASITDYSDLRVGLAASGTWSDVTHLRVHEIYLTITDAVAGGADYGFMGLVRIANPPRPQYTVRLPSWVRR